jgi:predicted TIM-barrel fold metal-dependent hydrolase
MSKIPAVPNTRFAQSIPRIDVHHHYFPSDLKKEQSNVGVGWKTPPENLPWSPKISLQAMDAMKVDFAVLSFPAISSGCISEENRATARRRNKLAAGFCRDHPDRFSFFATLPFLEDIEGQKLSFNWSIYFLIQ